jgi:hypothetical protein
LPHLEIRSILPEDRESLTASPADAGLIFGAACRELGGDHGPEKRRKALAFGDALPWEQQQEFALVLIDAVPSRDIEENPPLMRVPVLGRKQGKGCQPSLQELNP